MAFLSKKGGRQGSIDSQQKFDFFSYDDMPNMVDNRIHKIHFFHASDLHFYFQQTQKQDGGYLNPLNKYCIVLYCIVNIY